MLHTAHKETTRAVARDRTSGGNTELSQPAAHLYFYTALSTQVESSMRCKAASTRLRSRRTWLA